MCEYSLFSLPNRLARSGELLVTHRFSTGTMGLAPINEVDAPVVKAAADEARGLWSTVTQLFKRRSCPNDVTAVCIPPGSRLRINQLPPYSKQTRFLTPLAEVTFVELDVPENQYRDAIHFANGCVLLLQCVEEGVCFQVVSTDSREPELYRPQLEFDGWLR